MRTISLFLALALTTWLPGSVSAQSLGWALEMHQPWDYDDHDLVVVDLATGREAARFTAAPDVLFGNGAVTPDGRYYLLATNTGIARYRTNPVAFDRNIGPRGDVTHLSVSPVGTHVHAMGPHGRAVVDWESGDVIEVQCCEAPRVYFTPDGSVRLHVLPAQAGVRVTAFAEPAGTVLWERATTGYPYCEAAAASATDFALHCWDWDYPTIFLWRISTGAESQVVQFLRVAGLAWHGHRLLVSYEAFSIMQLVAYDPQHELSTVLAERPLPVDSAAGIVTVSPDERHAYWQTSHHILAPGGWTTLFDLVDLESDRRIATGSLIGNYYDFDISRGGWCDLGVPASVPAPVEGGVVGIPVVPPAGCATWSAPGQPAVLNPGPHIGAATLLVQTWANAEASEKTTPLRIGAQTVLIRQPSGVPSVPAMEAAIAGDRVTLSWTPAVGAGIRSFVIRGALDGRPMTDALTLPGHLRTWTSPSLPGGSYDVELVAANDAGRSAPSHRVSFSIGVTAAPGPPTDLVARVVDDRIELSWAVASTDPAPAGFVIEAAAGDTPFAAVARSDRPSFVATRVPAGLWRVRVRAVTAGGVSDPTPALSFTAAACSAPPAAPQQPWAIWTPPTVTLRWAPPLAGSVESYVVEVGSVTDQPDLGRFTVPGDRISITEPVSPLLAYVRVRARNACGESAASSEVPIVVY